MSTATPGTSKETAQRVLGGFLPFRIGAVAIGTDALGTRTPSGWTYQQMIAHVAAWHEATTVRLRALRETGSPLDLPELADADAFNARVAAVAARATPDEVLDRLAGSFEALRAELARIDEAALAAHDGWGAAVVAGNTLDHYAEHQAELMAAVPKRRDELLARFERGWERLRAAIADADLERRTASGWTGTGVVGHLPRWLEWVPDELERRLRGERGPVPEVDAANAQEAAAAQAEPAAAVVARLEATVSRVRGALEAVSADREIPFAAVGLVATQTYEHFRAHAQELEEIRG